MKIYNQNWHKAFAPWILQDGKKLADNGSVTDIKQEKGKIQARLQDGEKIKVTIDLGENENIHQMKCTGKFCGNVCYCKHCAAVLCKLYPVEDEELKKNVFLNPDESVESNLPRSASSKEKFDDIILQLRKRYFNRKVYALWTIEKENPKIKSATLNSWSKEVTGLTLSEYLLSIGLLSSTVKFEIIEDEVLPQDIRGKKCCSIGSNGLPNKWDEELLKNLGAKIVLPTDPELEYVIFDCSNILKEPEDENRNAFFLLSMKENGTKEFAILGFTFKNKAKEYLENLKNEEPLENTKEAKISEASSSNQLPKIDSLTDLMYFPKIKKDRKTIVDIAGQKITVINEISYGEKRGEWNELPKLKKKYPYYDVKTLSAKIKDLFEFDYTAIMYPENYRDIESVELGVAQNDIDFFIKICKLCQVPAVLNLISYIVKRNKDGSLKKRAVTPIIQTKYIPLDIKSKAPLYPPLDFEYYTLVAKNTDSEIRLEIRRNTLVSEHGDESYRLKNQDSSTSEELIEKILQIEKMIGNKDA